MMLMPSQDVLYDSSVFPPTDESSLQKKEMWMMLMLFFEKRILPHFSRLTGETFLARRRSAARDQ